MEPLKKDGKIEYDYSYYEEEITEEEELADGEEKTPAQKKKEYEDKKAA